MKTLSVTVSLWRCFWYYLENERKIHESMKLHKISYLSRKTKLFSYWCLLQQQKYPYIIYILLFCDISCKIQQPGAIFAVLLRQSWRQVVGHLEIVSLATLQPGYWSHVSGIIIHNGISSGIFSCDIIGDRLHRITVQTILAKTLLFFTHQKWVLMFLFKRTIICVNILKASRTIPWWSL